MPVRQATQGGVQSPALTGYNSAGVAAPQYQQPTDSGGGSSGMFWNSLLGSALKQGVEEGQKAEARNYLIGQQDSLAGREKQEKNAFVRQSYEEGYNKASVGAELAKFQLEVQNKAQEYVNSGKTPEEFQQYVNTRTNDLLNRAGAQGLNLQDKDWQAWLGGVQNTRETSADYYQTQNIKRSQYMKEQSISAEGAAAISQFTAADIAGNPQQALENVNNHIARINGDNSLSLEQKTQYTANFMVNAFTSAQHTGGVQGLTGYMQSLDEFKHMPTDVQTQLLNAAQQQYEKRAADESVQVYEYNSKVASVTDFNELTKQYPMQDYIDTVMGAVQRKNIGVGTGYSMVDSEVQRRAKLQKAATAQVAYGTGVTMSDIATQTGEGLDKVKSNLQKLYATNSGGWSGGGLNLMQRGLKSGSQDMTSAGIEMLTQDAQSLATVDWRNLKTDANGTPQYSATVVQSLTNLNSAYNSALASGNQVQANQLLSGLPDAVAYGIRQGVDSNTLASVVGRRANDMASGKVVALPRDMPREMLVTPADVSAGMFDFGIGQNARNRNAIGIQSWVFNSDSDEKAAQARVNQVNGAINNEYVTLQQQGALPALQGDDLKNWLVGRVTARTVRVDDGSDNGALLILPNVADKAKVFGTQDNELLTRALSDNVKQFKQQYPGATTVNMDYDPFTQEIIFQGVTSDNVIATTADSIPVSQLRSQVQAQQALITNGGMGALQGNLSVPGAGYVKYNTENKYQIQPQTMMKAVTQLVTYEGYNSNKGFSILDKHPTTGATLNEEKYVKQPTDTPQVAADKLSMYVNDKVLPDVMSTMPKYNSLPGFLKEAIFNQLVETTYHAGNSAAFATYIDKALAGAPLNDFKDSPLFKDAGAGSRRNIDRMQLLRAVNTYGYTRQ